MVDPALSPPFKDLLLFLATAGVVVPLFTRLRVGATLGFLTAGVALGPFGLGALTDEAPWLEALTIARPEEFEQLAELGVAFLLFSIGLELSWERLRLMRRLVFGLGTVQLAVATLALGAGLLLVVRDPEAAFVTGAALALSSTAMAVPALSRRHRLHAPAGRAAFAVLLFQDLAVAPLLAAIGLFATRQAGVGLETLYALAPAALILAVLILGGRLLLRPLMKLVARAKSQELFMAAALLVVIGSGVATSLAGLSMALGAFVAGVLLAETEYRHEVEVTIEPFAGLLLGLFFLSVGVRLDLPALWQSTSLVAGLTLGLLALKAMVNLVACRLFGLSPGASLEAALALAGGGEFAFVILGHASGAEIVPAALMRPLLVAVTLSMFATPGLVALGGYLERRVSAGDLRRDAAAPPAERRGRVIIVGMGRVGRLVADILDERGVAWTAVDRDPRAVSAERRRGRFIHFGDGSRIELLDRIGLAEAPALVVTMDAPDGVEAVVGTARHHHPDLVIVARARDDRHAARLYRLGATSAVPEAFEASLQLSEALLLDLGEPSAAVGELIRNRRRAFRDSISAPPPGEARR
ncbi:MAG: cation:proton antiporter [Phenylobacterium sp.]|uniref:cation:proton antiporter domain-containing protein n=1 Tax=Phenylobacterium sp. TaxID=1871053 RepID=UPI00391A3FA1